ncbi:MAG: ParB N-terminal domain-containing protein [Clostridia bacterium]|nr:ParB N-terminal domain-containing protein [Clostridia bacterium]
MQIFNLKINELKPYKNNAKKHDDVQIANVAESIKQFGMVQPIVVDKDNVVIIGHCRLEACKKLNYKEIPCVKADTLTDEQVAKLRLLDNKLNESEWDFELLGLELADLDMTGFDVDWGDLGFNDVASDVESETLILIK